MKRSKIYIILFNNNISGFKLPLLLSAEVEMIDINEEADRLDELELIKNERDEFRDRFVRALADAENARKRADKDRREAENYGGSKLARDLLPVYDNLKRAVDAVTDEQRSAASGLIEGVELTMRELLSVFTKHGITLISPDVGDKFDPKLHEAMFEAVSYTHLRAHET